MKIKTYVDNVLIGFDMFANTVLGGHPDETVSARSGRAAAEGKIWGKALSFLLGKIQRNHSQKAIIDDDARAKTVEYLEESAK